MNLPTTFPEAGMDLMTSPDQPCWYAVLTRSRQEKVAANMLEHLAVTTFLPLLQQERRWSDRKQLISLPLFPSYLFVRMLRTNELILRVLKVPGVVDFVRSRNGPMPIPETEMDSVRKALRQCVACSPHAFLKAGDRVRVVRGPLVGIEGMLIRNGSQSTLVISVEMIQQSVALTIDAADVEPISNALKQPSQRSAARPAMGENKIQAWNTVTLRRPLRKANCACLSWRNGSTAKS